MATIRFDGLDAYARMLTRLEKGAPQIIEKAVRAGYDIHTSAAVLQEFYLRRYAEVTK